MMKYKYRIYKTKRNYYCVLARPYVFKIIPCGTWRPLGYCNARLGTRIYHNHMPAGSDWSFYDVDGAHELILKFEDSLVSDPSACLKGVLRSLKDKQWEGFL